MYRFSFVFFFLAACVDDVPPASVQNNNDSGVTTIDRSFQADSINFMPESFDKTITAEIRLTWSGSYCNGAYPSDEMLEEIRKPRPLEETKVILKGEKTYDLNTDHRGRITVSLEPGSYELFLDRSNDSETTPFNIHCKKYYSQPWGSLRVDSNKTAYKMHIEFPCDLCDETIKRRP